jgi:hypothetical protein
LVPSADLTDSTLEAIAHFQTVSLRTPVNRAREPGLLLEFRGLVSTNGGGWERSRGSLMPVSGRRLAVLALVVTMTIWGSSFVVTKLVLDEAGPFTVTVLRFGLGLLVLLPFA